MQSYKSEGLDTNLYEEKYGFEKQNAREMKTRVETLLQGLGHTHSGAQVLFCTFLFQIRIFPNEIDMDARSILITSLG